MEMNLRMVVAAVQELQRQMNQLEQRIAEIENRPIPASLPNQGRPILTLRGSGSPLDRG